MTMQTMADVLQRVATIRAKGLQYQNELATRFGIPLGDPPIGGLGICHNTATLTLELLSFYNDIWAKIDPKTVTNAAQARQQNAERVMLVTKAFYILALSGFEFAAKNGLPLRSNKLMLGGGRIYLGSIMGASRDANLISQNTFELWSGAIELRNTLVHNNGIADRTATYQFPDVKIELRQGQMATDGLLFFAALTDWATDSFRDWCTAFLTG